MTNHGWLFWTTRMPKGNVIDMVVYQSHTYIIRHAAIPENMYNITIEFAAIVHGLPQAFEVCLLQNLF